MSDIAIEALRWTAAGATIIAAIIVAWGPSPRVMVFGFVLFCLAAVSWIVSGFVQDRPALLAQNAVLLAINGFGIWRWSRRVSSSKGEMQ